MIAGRAIERLGQFHEGLPVFGGQVVRQMDGRAIVSVTGRLYEALDVDVNPSISAARANEIAVAAAGAGANIRGETTLGILPVESGYRLVYRMVVLSAWAIRDVYVDAGTGEIVLSINGIHTQAAVGQGNGIFGTLRKMSTNRTSTTFQAVDKLRPGEAFTLAFPGTPARLNFFLQTLVLFNSDVATDSDNVWTDGPTVDAHVFQGWVYDYYFKRFGRRGMDDRNIEVDSIVHPLSRSEANRQPPEVVGTYINNAFYCCDGVLVFGDGDGRLFTFLAGGFDVVAHEWTHGVTDFSSELIYRDESGALNEAFSDIMGAAMEFYYYPTGSGERSSRLVDRRRCLSRIARISAIPQQSLRQGASRPLQPAPLYRNGHRRRRRALQHDDRHARVLSGCRRRPQQRVGRDRAGRRSRQYRAHGADFLPRIYAS